MVALVLALNLCGEVFAYGYAQDYVTQYPRYNSDYEISGTNAFGSMMADAVNNKLNEQQENAGYNVFSVEITGQTATVELETLCDSTVVIGIYDEQGVNLLMTASASVTPNDEYVTVTFDQYLPQYFFIKAYLIDSATLRPLCTVYDCPNYTQEMQEFFSKTVYDFSPEKVLNLDSDVTNNFAVYSDIVTVIPRVDGINTLVFQGDGTYVFANADENICNLQPNQVFSYEYASGEVIIAKVAAVTENPDGTVTVSERDAELEDAFEYIKIDTEAGMDKAEIDNSNLEEGVEFVGMDYENANPYGIMPTALEGEITSGGSAKYNINIKDFGNETIKVSINGSVSFSLNANLKYYVALDYQYIEVSLKYKATISLSVEGKVTGKFELGDFGISPVPGLYIGITPSVVVEFSVKLAISGTASGSVGFSFSSTEGCRNISKPIQFSSALELEGRAYLGFSLEPKIKIISENVAEVKLTAQTGLELTAKTAIYDTTTVGKQIHDCVLCFEGSLNWVIDLGFKASLFDWDKLTASKSWQFKQKIFDYYYSSSRNELGIGKCPHIKYKVDVTVTDMAGDMIEGAEVTISDGQKFTTGEDGQISELFLPNGWYTITAKLVDRSPCAKKIYIHNSGESVVLPIGMNFATGGGGSSWNPDIGGSGGGGSWGDGDYLLPDGSKRVKQVSLGSTHSAAITADGCLYLWGSNNHGELGNGKEIYDRYGDYNEGIDSNIPIKIMDDVAYVSLGNSYSSAITTDGSLYMWGCNFNGELGNGTTNNSTIPVKIMDNVAYVCLSKNGSSRNYSAAITTDGSLYTWGWNSFGRLGNGTTDDSHVPQKIMDNVISVSLGRDHCAAVTVDGSLYMWGHNYNAFGNGTGEDSLVPIKVMDNVSQISLGQLHSAAITIDGGLYIWGDNIAGELGIGSGEDSLTPVKIMDNVKSVSLGAFQSAAISADHILYFWGSYSNYFFGNSSPQNSYKPTKIAENVSSASLGHFDRAIIYTDGSLYTWGKNWEGMLGNGTTEDSSVPIKISIPADDSAPTSISTLSALPMAVEETSPTVGTFIDLIPNEIYNIYALRSRTAAEPLAASNLLYIAQATSDAVGNLPYNCELLEDCPNPIIFCKAMSEFDLGNAQISAADVTHDSITVKWEAYPCADMYRVYRVVNGIYLELGTTAETSFTVSELNPNREYGFLVSCRVNGEWSYPSPDDVAYIATAAEPYTLGDVNDDGEVNLDDAVLALQKAMKVDVTSAVFIDEAADVNGDGEINLDDAVEILKIAMKVS